jgi:hypothetical protein
VSARLEPLSSPWTPLVKWSPAMFWLCFLVMAVHGVLTHHEERGERILFLLLFTPLLLCWQWWNWRLLDAVELGERELRLRRRGLEQRVELKDVMTVIPGRTNVPTFVRLRLRRAGPLGDEVCFATRLATVPGGSYWSPRLRVVESLIAAVDAAKLGAVA